MEAESGADFHVGEDGFFDYVFLVRAEADADVERSFERDRNRASRHLEVLAFRCEPHVGVLAALFDAHASGRGDIRLDLVRERALRVAILKRS